MDIATRVKAITEAGWDSDSVGWDSDSGTDSEQFEALVHELAHNFILGDLRPKTMGQTSELIRKQLFIQADQDEILTTAVTIQVCDSFYCTPACDDAALSSVARNVRTPTLQADAEALVIELLNTPKVMAIAGELHAYIESLV